LKKKYERTIPIVSFKNGISFFICAVNNVNKLLHCNQQLKGLVIMLKVKHYFCNTNIKLTKHSEGTFSFVSLENRIFLFIHAVNNVNKLLHSNEQLQGLAIMLKVKHYFCNTNIKLTKHSEGTFSFVSLENRIFLFIHAVNNANSFFHATENKKCLEANI
jgi:hypothetical protein